MSKNSSNIIREYKITEKLGAGSFGTVYKVFKKGK